MQRSNMYPLPVSCVNKINSTFFIEPGSASSATIIDTSEQYLYGTENFISSWIDFCQTADRSRGDE